MKKSAYEMPQVKVVIYECEDVISASTTANLTDTDYAGL